jgi:hypothetical protein
LLIFILILFYFNKNFVHHPKLFPTRRSWLRSERSGGKKRKVGGGARRRGVHEAAAYKIGIEVERGWRTKEEPHD